MASRSGMAELIDILRGMADAQNDQYLIGTANYWDAE